MALNGTVKACLSCKFTVLFELTSSRSLCRVTVNEGNTLVPPPTLLPVATSVRARPASTVWPALFVPFQVNVLLPAAAVTDVSKMSVPAELVIETDTGSAAGDVMFTVPWLFCNGI